VAGSLAFHRLRASAQVRIYLGRVPVPVRRCLVNALEAIKDKRLRMLADPTRPDLFITTACGHQITVAASRDGATVVVLDLEFLEEEPSP
jgi:hypothetical protein